METAGLTKSKPSLPGSRPSPVQRAGQVTLDPAERKDIHVLVVEDKYAHLPSFLFSTFLTTFSAINQQIALKTIKRLGFSVNAVWNGKEALDYLMEMHTPTRPKPDLILMDVQMPVLDGYRATHLIRHHSPYSSLPGIQSTPIVAMTASAIHGDREKCKRAGMDDYLAKPVRSHTLETMLVKWALKVKRSDHEPRSFRSEHTDADSNCSNFHPSSPLMKAVANSGSVSTAIPEASISDRATATPMPSGQSPLRHSKQPPSDAHAPIARALSSKPHKVGQTTVVDRLPPAESEGDRGLRRAAAEEKAVELRNDKLLSAAEEESHYPQQGAHNLHGQSSPSTELPPRSAPTGRLTEENVTKLGLGRANQQHKDSLTMGTMTEDVADLDEYDDDDDDDDDEEEAVDGGTEGEAAMTPEPEPPLELEGNGALLSTGVGLGFNPSLGAAHSHNTSLTAQRGSVGSEGDLFLPAGSSSAAVSPGGSEMTITKVTGIGVGVGVRSPLT
ncbi:MAG: hypothetical protein LQ340_003662, partial [Diploschistes diacapsis]